MDSRSSEALESLRGNDMTAQKAQSIGISLGAAYKRVAVAVDAMPSSPMVRDALVSGLTAAGAEVIDAGMAAAPVACVALGDSADCIAVIGSPDSFGTVSGMSLFNPDGSRFTAEQAERVFGGEEIVLPDYSGVGRVRKEPYANETYVKRVAAGTVDTGGYVIVDCGCGSPSLSAPAVLAATGADVVSLNAHSGERIPPRSGIDKAELAGLADFVNASTGSIGIAYNGDGTRVGLMDEGGKMVPGQYLLALMMMIVRPKRAVVPFDSPKVIEDAFWSPINPVTEEENVGDRRLIRTGNDEASVIRAIRDNDADFAGTPDGRFIFPERTLCPDGIYASVLLSWLSGQRSVRNILEQLPAYITGETRVRYPGDIERFGREFLDRISKEDVREVAVGDGWKVILNEGMYYVREDPDDPNYLKVSGEAADRLYLVSMLDQAKDIVGSCQ